MTSRRQLVQTMGGALLAGALPRRARAAADAMDEFRAIPKAMWVWKTEFDELGELASFARHWSIARVLLALRPHAIERLARSDVAAVEPLARLKSVGITVTALTGDPSWVDHAGLPRTVAKILDVFGRSEAFAGLDLDIEPHALRSWREGGATRERLMQGLLHQIDAVRARAPQVELGAALNPIYAKLTLPDGGNFLEAVARRLNSAALMAYRPSAHATMAWGAPAIDIFEQTRTPWWSGVLVHKGDENTSYHGTPKAQFLADMVALHNGNATHRSYRGLIFEDYAGLRELLREGDG